MLNTQILKEMIIGIFGMSEEQVVPITADWYIPEVNLDEYRDCIGYRILSKCLRSSEVVNNSNASRIDKLTNKKDKHFRTEFRLSFVGEHAEQLSEQVLLWETDYKIKKMFTRINAELDFSGITLFTYPMKSGNSIAWIVDMSVIIFSE